MIWRAKLSIYQTGATMELAIRALDDGSLSIDLPPHAMMHAWTGGAVTVWAEEPWDYDPFLDANDHVPPGDAEPPAR